ncbi:MAG: C40 family peptidase [Bacteroidetes bacterium]|nr:C40 family peptidase [Bacteroidota bacterium]
MYGIIHLSVIPVRKEPSDRSEMITQLLFGDTFKSIGEKDNWLFIHSDADGYEGWIDRKQSTEISEAEHKKIISAPSFVSKDLFGIITNKNSGESFPIPLGCSLPEYFDGMCSLAKNNFSFDGKVCYPNEKTTRDEIVETALLFLNSPYLWGGKTFLGIDCSGFTQTVFKANGIKLKRDAWQQAETGTSYSFVEESHAGDLAFFDNEEGKITHVGIVIHDNRIIHASGRVRIDHFDHYGIFTPERGGYTHNLRVIKNIVG